MKWIYKYIIAVILCCTTIESCVMSSVVEDIDDIINIDAYNYSKSEEIKEGFLSVKVINIAPNTYLQIDSMEICNVMIKDEITGGLKDGSIILDSTRIKLPVQKFNSWIPDVLPQNSNKMYVRLDGKIYMSIANNTTFVLCNGPMYFTFDGIINENQTTDVKFVVNDRCQLYCEVDGKMVKVLQSISFDVSVDDWEE